MRIRSVVVCLSLLAALPAVAQRTPVPLNDYTRLGQRFTVTRPVIAVAVTVPSWSDDEGGLTLSLWDTPERTKLLARRILSGIRDNEGVEVKPAQPLPVGSYYWEIAERTGTTRIGLYCDALPDDTADCAWLDGQADPRRRFVYNVVVGPPARESVQLLARILETGTAEERAGACRELAVYGTAEAVPALARLLADPALGHMARYALESLPDPAVDEALRAALSQLQGAPLVGVINSIAVRRDAGAVAGLAALLPHADAALAAAAAVALGRIGNAAAGQVLGQALAGRPSAGLYEGGLECAGRLLAEGQHEAAAPLFDRLRQEPAPRAVRLAATRGFVLSGGPAGLDLMPLLLRDNDPEIRGVALWIVQHELPGEALTRSWAGELAKLAGESKIGLLTALAGRGDPAALPALTAASGDADPAVRKAAIAALPRFGAAAAPALVLLVSDAEVGQAVRDALASLPRQAAAEVAGQLLASPEPLRRQAGIALIQRLKLPGFGDGLAAALRDPEAGVRTAAAKALEELGGEPQVAAVRDALLAATDESEAKGLESALAAVGQRVGRPDEVAAQIVAALDQAPPARRLALLRTLGVIGGGRSLEVIRQAVAGPAGEERQAALDLLCAWPTAAAAPDLLRLAKEAATPAEQLTCLRGALRLAAGEDLAADERLGLCRELAALVQRDEEKKLLLSALGGLNSIDAIEMVLPYLEAAATQEEACAAGLGIAERVVKGPEKARLVGPLERIAAVASADFAKRAKELLTQAKSAG